MSVPLPPPTSAAVRPPELRPARGITIAEAGQLLHYSRETIRRMIENRELVAWKPRGPLGRRWLIDEVSLAIIQQAHQTRARRDAAPMQQMLLGI